jgi:hypothetical protein
VGKVPTVTLKTRWQPTVTSVGGQGRQRGEAPMTIIQAVFLGMMLALTPSMVLLAFLVWREEIGLRQVNSDFDDHPPYPNTQ